MVHRVILAVDRRRDHSRSSGSRGSGDAIPAPHRTGEFRRVDSGSHDGERADLRGTLLSLLLLELLERGDLGPGLGALDRAHPLPRPSARVRSLRPKPNRRGPKAADPDALATLPPIPAENVASVGQTMRIGDIEVTPLSVSLAPVELVRAIDPARLSTRR